MKEIKDIQDITSESVVISTIVNKPSFINYYSGIKSSHFYDDFHECMFFAIQELVSVGVMDIDFKAIKSALSNTTTNYRKKGEMISESDIVEFLKLSTSMVAKSQSEYIMYCKNVVSFAYKRQVFKETCTIQRYCFDWNATLEDIQKVYYDTFNNVSSEYSFDEDNIEFSEVVDELFMKTTTFKDDVKYNIKSKFKANEKYFTYENGELVVVAAKRKVGKSAYTTNEALHLMENGYSVLYLDTELSTRKFFERILSLKSGVEIKRIKSGLYTEPEKEQIESAKKFLKSQKFVHIYKPRWTKEDIYAKVLYWKNKIGVDFVVYDYMKSSASSASEVYNDLGEMTNFLKNDIAGGFDIPVLSCAQLNRGGDIQDSFKIEQYASTILNLLKKDYKTIERDGRDCGNYKLFVKLNRNGESMEDPDYDYIDLNFNGNLMSFVEAKSQHDNDDDFPL